MHTFGVERVYFTWPDRRFCYTCRGCGACCKGHGIGLDVAAGELVQLVARRPEITTFLRRRGDAITAFNPRDRCWFFDDDGACRIEREDGRAAKPASCRLFPFNRVFRIGSYVVVDFNSVICPLQAGTEGIAHADVLAEIEGIQDAAVVGTQLPAVKPEDEGHGFVTFERRVAEVIFAHADTGQIEIAWQIQASHKAAFDIELAKQSEAFRAIAGTPFALPNAETLSNALWLTPSMRFNELYGPRQYAVRARMEHVLARMWLAWLGFAHLGEQLAGRPLGLQELTTLWSEQAPLMHAIARWRETPALRPGPIDLPGVDPGGLVRSLGQAFVDNRKARRTFGEVVSTHAAWAGSDPIQRITALKVADAVMRAGFAR